ncbi:MAG TPA: cytochrome P450 [Ilumatobacter sp.]|nr:cytochrome P450 [Ilumatobacter sp.]
MSSDNLHDEHGAPITAPVLDWASDYDIFDQGYVNDPYGIWDELRQTCPMAHTERWGGSWLPTTYKDVYAIAHDIEKFPSGNGISVVPLAPVATDGPAPLHVPAPVLTSGVPPISADPPLHTWTRRLILPTMSPARVAEYEVFTRELCQRLVDEILERGTGDAAADYAQQIPVRVIGHILGVPEDMSDTFTEWVRDVLEFAHDVERRQRGIGGIIRYLQETIEARQAEPQDDFITELLHSEHDGEPVGIPVVMGMCALLLIAGIDTTWSSIGSTMWHLAAHPEDRRRLVAEPDLMPTAIEEFLRAYAPVTMARRLTEDTEYEGCPIKAGERILMNFPAANRDPAAFPDADKVILDRQQNRHLAFGAGIHRCAGSNLARMELRVAIEEWLARIPEFELVDPATVTWAGGQVRGPRSIPVRIS